MIGLDHAFLLAATATPPLRRLTEVVDVPVNASLTLEDCEEQEEVSRDHTGLESGAGTPGR